MAQYIPFSELPTRDVLSQHIDGSEPDIQLATEMMHDAQEMFNRHHIIWDVNLPSGANDNDRIELNATRMAHIRVLGQFSLIHFIDVSNEEPRSQFMGDGGVENGVLIGLNVERMASWAMGRHKGLLQLMDPSGPVLPQDLVVADELEGVVGYTLQEASRELAPIRQRAVGALARLPGLVRVRPSSDSRKERL